MADQTSSAYDHKFVIWFWRITSIIVAVAVAVLITTYIERDNLIAGCTRNGDSKIIDAHFYDSAAVKNEKVAAASTNPQEREANLKAAKEYRQFEIDKRNTIEMPNGWAGDINTRGDDPHQRAEGCQDAFPAPIPFIQ